MTMPSYLYILECADGSYYTGSTRNIERRLWQHANGEGANFTKKRLPFTLVYAEPFDRVEDAYRREKQIQGWSRRKKQALIEANYEKLVEFSKNYTQYGRPASAESASTSSADGDSRGLSLSKANGVTHPLPVPTNPLPEPVEGSISASTSSADGDTRGLNLSKAALNQRIAENLARVTYE